MWGILFGVDWYKLFVPSVSILETMLRGTIMYLLLFTLIRLVLKRVGGAFSLADILMVALIAAAAQNAMAREHQSVTDGLVLVITIVFWDYALDWLGHRYPWFQRWYQPPPLLLVKNGQLLQRNMRTELITKDELLTELRRNGIKQVAHVKEAYMEADGQITVIERDA